MKRTELIFLVFIEAVLILAADQHPNGVGWYVVLAGLMPFVARIIFEEDPK